MEHKIKKRRPGRLVIKTSDIEVIEDVKPLTAWRMHRRLLILLGKPLKGGKISVREYCNKKGLNVDEVVEYVLAKTGKELYNHKNQNNE